MSRGLGDRRVSQERTASGHGAETINISSKGFTETRYREYNDLLLIAIENLKKAIEYDPFYHSG